MLYRGFLSLVDRLPLPSLRAQRLTALLVVLTQGGIAVTGTIVRVTASGLGCPTWPQCFPGSFVPVPVAEVPVFHQAIEFGNRMLTGVVVVCAGLVVLAVTRARRRREVLVYAWLMPGGTVLQAIIGGITVRAGLLWWTVAIHLLASMLMVWLATLLYVKVGEPDDGIPVDRVRPGLRRVTALAGAALGGVLVAGTTVAGAGPHAGDKSADRIVPRLAVEIETVVHIHAILLLVYLGLLVVVLTWLSASNAPAPVQKRTRILLVVVLLQATVGMEQYAQGVPAVLVVVHVAGAVACTVATAALWASMRVREPLPSVQPVSPGTA